MQRSLSPFSRSIARNDPVSKLLRRTMNTLAKSGWLHPSSRRAGCETRPNEATRKGIRPDKGPRLSHHS